MNDKSLNPILELGSGSWLATALTFIPSQIQSCPFIQYYQEKEINKNHKKMLKGGKAETQMNFSPKHENKALFDNPASGRPGKKFLPSSVSAVNLFGQGRTPQSGSLGDLKGFRKKQQLQPIRQPKPLMDKGPKVKEEFWENHQRFYEAKKPYANGYHSSQTQKRHHHNNNNFTSNNGFHANSSKNNLSHSIGEIQIVQQADSMTRDVQTPQGAQVKAVISGSNPYALSCGNQMLRDSFQVAIRKTQNYKKRWIIRKVKIQRKDSPTQDFLNRKQDLFPHDNFFMEDGQLYSKKSKDEPDLIDLGELLASATQQNYTYNDLLALQQEIFIYQQKNAAAAGSYQTSQTANNNNNNQKSLHKNSNHGRESQKSKRVLELMLNVGQKQPLAHLNLAENIRLLPLYSVNFPDIIEKAIFVNKIFLPSAMQQQKIVDSLQNRGNQASQNLSVYSSFE